MGTIQKLNYEKYSFKIKMQDNNDNDICFILWLLNGKFLIHLCLLNI
jgi:hypothetical protein